MPDDEKDGKGTAQSSGSSSQGKRQRKSKYADDSSAPTDPAKVVTEGGPPRNAQNVEGVAGTNWPGSGQRGDSDALIGHFANIVGELEVEGTDGEKHSVTGLYGVVQSVTKVGEHGEPLEASFEVRTRAGLGRPELGTDTITVPWENLRRAAAGAR